MCVYVCVCAVSMQRWLSIDSFLCFRSFFVFHVLFMHTYFRRLTLMMRKRAEHFRDEKYGSKSKEMEYKVI